MIPRRLIMLNSVFSFDSPIFQFLSKMADLITLNLLYIICCLPVFTIGAASSALYSQTLKMAKNEEGAIVRGFFGAFRENFKKATLCWLILFAAGIILFLDFHLAQGLFPETMERVFRIVILFLSFIWLMSFTYIFPLLAKFENTVKNSLINSVLMSIRHLPFTLIMLVFYALPVLALYYFGQYIMYELLILLLIWYSGIAYLNSKLFNRIFKAYIPAEEK